MSLEANFGMKIGANFEHSYISVEARKTHPTHLLHRQNQAHIFTDLVAWPIGRADHSPVPPGLYR